jgi:hypothetical protein
LAGRTKLTAQTVVLTTGVVAVSTASLRRGSTGDTVAKGFKIRSPPGNSTGESDRLGAQVLDCRGCQSLAGSSDRVWRVGRCEDASLDVVGQGLELFSRECAHSIPQHNWLCWQGVGGHGWRGEVADYHLVVGHGPGTSEVGLGLEGRAAVVQEVEGGVTA